MTIGKETRDRLIYGRKGVCSGRRAIRGTVISFGELGFHTVGGNQMTVTYTEDRITPFAETGEAGREDAFVPVYARTGRKTRHAGGKVKTWMILAPIGAVVLGGTAVAMMLSGSETAEPALSEPAATAPVTPIAPLATPTVAAPQA